MKNLPLLMLLLLANVFLQPLKTVAQTSNELPPFSMTLSSGQFFKAAEIKKDRPVLLIYFAPDCDHCHTLMNGFFQRAGDFKNAEVIMVTFKPVSEVRSFEKSYKTYQYPNIKVGTEGSTYYLRLFYKLQNTPFAALYNREGKLVTSYRKEVPLNDLLKKLKTL